MNRQTGRTRKQLKERKKKVQTEEVVQSDFLVNPDWKWYIENGYSLSLLNIIQVLYELFLDLYNGKKPWLQTIMFMGARQSGKTHPITLFLMWCFLSIPDTIVYFCRGKYLQTQNSKKQVINELRRIGFPANPKDTIRTTPQDLIQNPYLTNTAYWNNQIIFKTLNPEKQNITSGEGTGETTWTGAKLIILFFEEATSHNEALVEQFIQSVRGDKDTCIITFFAANPWMNTNWYVQRFNKFLPPSLDEMENNGYQIKFMPHYETVDGEQVFLGNMFLWRSAVFLNPYLKKQTIAQLKSLKNISQNNYNVCYLGVDGVAEGGLYTVSLEHMAAIESTVFEDDPYGEWEVVAGLDWGNGVAKNASPTTIHIGLINEILGLRVLKEFTYYNQDNPHTDSEIMSMCIKWLKKQWEWLNTFRYSCNNKIKCFVDDAQSPTFVATFNELLEPNGATKEILEFFPATKYDIRERVDITNWMLGYAQLRIDTSECTRLYSALQSCKQHIPRNGIVNKDIPFRRTHDYEHWINSGVEYIMNDYFYKFREKPAVVYGWDSIEEKNKDNDDNEIYD